MPSSAFLFVLALALLASLAAPGADAASTRLAHRHLRHRSEAASLAQEPAADDAEAAEDAEDGEDSDSDDEDDADDADSNETSATDVEDGEDATALGNEECMVVKKGTVAPSAGVYYPGSPDGVDIQEIPFRTGDLAPTLGMFCGSAHHCYMLQKGTEAPADGNFFPGSSDVQKIKVNKGAVTPQVGLFCVGVAGNSSDVGTQMEKARLEQAVRDAHDALVANLRKQVDVNAEIKHLDDEARMHKEVDDSVQEVANETQSWATANFLGDMWNEMRMFAKPFYKEHLEEQLGGLEAKGKLLQSQFNASQAALTAWSPKIEVPP